MEILPLGHASFKLRGKQATIVTDPYDGAMVGIKYPKHIEADIITVSHDHGDHNAVDVVGGSPYVVRGPGEYEIKGVSIIGVASFHDEKDGSERGKNTMYRIEIDGIKIVHLGDLGHVLSTAAVDALDGVDILMVPVGGVYTLDPAKAMSVIAEIEPKIVIPMHYRTPEHDQKSFGTLGSVDDFLLAANKGSVTPVPKLTVSRDKLPAEMQIVVLG